VFSRKPIFGYKAMVYAMLSIGIMGFMVWGHHMFMSGMSPYSGFAFSVMTMAIGVPSRSRLSIARHAVGWEDPVFIAMFSQSDLCLICLWWNQRSFPRAASA